MEIQHQSMNDHDLLIRVDTRLETLIGEVQLMRDNTNQRLAKVEDGKLEKADFNDFRNELNKALETRTKENDIRFTNLERSVNRLIWLVAIGAGVLGTLQFLAPIALKAFNF